MTPTEAKRYLDSFIDYELKPSIPYAPSLKLERVFYLLKLIGNPHQQLKTIHVAGTKGKGSTCAFTAFILQAAGYKVGLYTSPHLHDERERIRILDSSSRLNHQDDFFGKISEGKFCRLLGKIKPKIEAARLEKKFGSISFFEVYTALALCYFAEQKVDLAVLETGLGGRLDATNVTDSLVCAVTPISIEHTIQLGTTIKEIAAEKAAIIKEKNQVVVIAPQDPEAMAIIEERCRAVGARFFVVGKEILCQPLKCDIAKQTFEVQTQHYRYCDLSTHLLGRHQALNCAVAIGIVESLRSSGFNISPAAIKKGVENSIWPGRFEIIEHDPLIILDGAHNPGSCKVLASAIKDIFPKKKVTLILGISNDKDRRGICCELNLISNKVILTKSCHPRAFDFTKADAKDLFNHRDIILSESVKEAVDKALKETDREDIILVTGSFFTVGEARAICINHN